MADITILAIAIVAMIIASFSDFKSREVPDWLNYGLIFMALGYRLLYSIINNHWMFFVYGLFGLAIFAAIAFAMFYAGQWGGGDAKLLMGLGALIGFSLRDMFLIHFFVNMLLIGAVYGILFSVVLAVRKRRGFSKEVNKVMNRRNVLILRRYVLILVIAALIAAFLLRDPMLKLPLLFLSIIIFLTFYVWFFVKAVEKSCMFKLVSPEKLTEGDWIAKDIKIGNKIVYKKKNIGVENKDIQKLIKLKKQGKIKKILIKEGIPFVPSFLVAFVITYFFGNLVFLFI